MFNNINSHNVSHVVQDDILTMCLLCCPRLFAYHVSYVVQDDICVAHLH